MFLSLRPEAHILISNICLLSCTVAIECILLNDPTRLDCTRY